MISTEQELQALTEERQRSAAKVRSLLVQLEEAEKEFAAITQKVEALRDPAAVTRAPRTTPPVNPPKFCVSATPRA